MNRHTRKHKHDDDQHAQAQPAPSAGTRATENARSPRPSENVGNVEGEGSYTATRRYNDGLREHIQTHDVESEAEAAREALEGDEREDLVQAEERGKRRAAQTEARPVQGGSATPKRGPAKPSSAKH